MAETAALGSLEEQVRATEQELISVWAQIGYSDAVKAQKTGAMKEAIRGVLEGSIAAEKNELAERSDALELTVSTISIVTEELTGTKTSPQAPAGPGLLQRQAAASKKLAGLERERQHRLQSLQSTQAELNTLRIDLGQKIVVVEDGAEGADLTRGRLDKAEASLQRTLQEHEDLSAATIKLMTQMQEIERELGITDFVFRVPAQLSLRERNDRLVAHLRELCNDKQRRQADLDLSKAEIVRLSDRLSVTKSEQSAYFEQFAGRELFECVLSTYQEKIDCLKQEMKDRLHTMVSDLRAKIVNLWGIIGHDENEQAEFLNHPLGMNVSVSEIAEQGEVAMEKFLGRHEEELQELERQHAQLKPILACIQQREDAKERLSEISKANAYGKDANRGGRMLKLLKETKLREKQVKECEKKLLHLIPLWENSVNKPFLYEGERLSQVLQPRTSSIPRVRAAPTPARSKEAKVKTAPTANKAVTSAAKTPSRKAVVVKPVTAQSVRKATREESASLRTPRHRTGATVKRTAVSTKTIGSTKTPRTRDPLTQKSKHRTRVPASNTGAATEQIPRPAAVSSQDTTESRVPSAAVSTPSITPKAANITRSKRLRATASSKKTPQLVYRSKAAQQTKAALGNASNRVTLSQGLGAKADAATPLDSSKRLGKRLSSDMMDENACVTPMKGKRQRIA